MAKESALKGTEKQNHKYLKREWKNGKWQYWYKDPAKPTTDVSKLRTQSKASNTSATSTTGRKTGDWAKAWLENKNKKSSVVGNNSVAAKVSSGKAAVSKLVKTDSVYKAKTTTSPVLNNEEYKKKAEELDTEAKTKMEQNEQQYKVAYEKEVESYREKFLGPLRSQYGDSIPEEELAKVNSKVDEYTKTLWKDVYEPQVKRINSAIEEANKQIQRALKKRYESEDSVSHYELMHHGIPGQKWGERNGPPYPLGQNQKSASEKKEGKKKFHLTDKQKKYLKIGLAVAGAGLAVYGLYKIGTLDRLVNVGKNSMTNLDISGEKGLPDNRTSSNIYIKSEERISMDEGDKPIHAQIELEDFKKKMYDKRTIPSMEDLKKATEPYYEEAFNKGNFEPLLKDNNPGYKIFPSRKSNCFSGTTSLIMRLKGYDTSAISDREGWASILSESLFPGSSYKKIDSHEPEDIITTLLKNGNNRYGYMKVHWSTGGTHSLLYLVENNKVHFLDGQFGKRYNSERLLSNIIVDCTAYNDVTDYEPSELVLGLLSNRIKITDFIRKIFR